MLTFNFHLNLYVSLSKCNWVKPKKSSFQTAKQQNVILKKGDDFLCPLYMVKAKSLGKYYRGRNVKKRFYSLGI